MDRGDPRRAVTDFSQVIALNPKGAHAYFARGHAHLYGNALAKALADLNQSSELDPKSAYEALWLDIANKRIDLPSRLVEATTRIDMTKWPAPILRLYLGQMTPDAVLAAAESPNAQMQRDQICEANFYGGELALQRGTKDEATRLFKLATDGCPKSSIEYQSATAELKALGPLRFPD